MSNQHFKMMFTSIFRWDYKKGANELGISERQVRRYLQDHKVSEPVMKLMTIIYKGYLPDFGPWADCKILIDGTMQTPWGKVKASDVQLVHRYKWSARESEKMYKSIKQKNLESDAYLTSLQDKLLDIVGDLTEFYGTQ